MISDFISRITGSLKSIKADPDASDFPYYFKQLPKGALEYDRIQSWLSLADDVMSVVNDTIISMSRQNIAKSAKTHKTISKRLNAILKEYQSVWSENLLTINYGAVLTHGLISSGQDNFSVVKWFKNRAKPYKVGSGGWTSSQSVFEIQSKLSILTGTVEGVWDQFALMRDAGFGVARATPRLDARENSESGSAILTTCFRILGLIISMSAQSVLQVAKSIG